MSVDRRGTTFDLRYLVGLACARGVPQDGQWMLNICVSTTELSNGKQELQPSDMLPTHCLAAYNNSKLRTRAFRESSECAKSYPRKFIARFQIVEEVKHRVTNSSRADTGMSEVGP